jgi:hypothetical protein
MSLHPKILFIANKWSCGNKNYGLAEWEMGLQKSLESTGLADFDAFHFDDYYFTTGKHGDAALLQKIVEYKPDIIYLITNKMPGTDFDIMDWPTLDRIKDDFKIPMAAMWSDLQRNDQVKISEALLPYIVLNQSQGSSAALFRINKPEKYLHTWVPKDPRVFNNPGTNRDVDVSYFGSLRKKRLKYFKYLEKNGIKITSGGGESTQHLTTEQYAEKYRKSKIALSFARAGAIHINNARPFEIEPCGAMLLQQESFELMKWYIPYVDYVPYSNKKDMLKKARYYLTHDEERAKIARSGQEKSERLYSAKRFWQIVIDKTLGTNSGASYTFDYAIPVESLARLSPFKAFEMRLVNYLNGTSIGFAIYKAFNWRYWQDVFGEIWHKVFFVPIGKVKPFLQRKMSKKTFDFILKTKRKIIKTH